MKKFILILLVWVSGTTFLQAGAVSLTPAEINRIQALIKTSPGAAQWAKSLEKSAEGNLTQTPHPIDRIQTAGQLKGSDTKTRTEEALKDIYRLKTLEWAFVFTGRENFERKAQDYVLSWAKTCQPPENPIDATNLETLIETYDLIRADVAPADQALVDGWLRKVTQTLIASDDPRKKTHINNWQAHRLKIIGMAAFTLGDPALEQQVLDSFKTLLQANLNGDGTTYDFLERDALHYHIYDLEPMIRLAMVYQRAQNLDLYHWKTDNGASMAQCVAFLLPYAKGEKTHAEYVHTQVKFDIQRAQNHEKGHGIGEPFDPKAAQKCLELAQYYQPELKSLVGQLTGKPDSVYPSLQVLLNEMIRPVTPTTPTTPTSK